MAGGVIGEASIVIGADASDVSSDVKSQATKGLSGLGKTLGKTISDGLGAALKVGGAAAGTTLAVALTKGFNRLEAIDTATAKLAGLGNSAGQIESIMKSATAAVRGTAFGLGDAASAAAQFSAAGIPLEGMQRTLSILASTTAVAGGSMSELTTIFGKVAATGKLNGEVIAQLSERGIPILSLLSKQLGVTSADVAKMASSGQIDFETFQTALEAGLGPAAQAIGQSFSGMLQNVGAALGRFGAEAQKPIFESLKIVFPGIISFFDQLTGSLKPVTEVLMPKFTAGATALSDALSAISFGTTASGVESFFQALTPLLPVLGALVAALGPILTGLPVIGGLFAGITAPVGLLAGALISLFAVDPTTLLAGFQSLATSLASLIPKIASTIIDGLTGIIPELVANLSANLGIFINGITQLLLTAIPAITAALPQIVAALLNLIPMLVTALLGQIPVMLQAALQLFQGIIQAIVVVVPQVITALVAMLPQLATAIVGMLPQIVASALALFSGLVTGLLDAIPVVLETLIGALPQILETLLDMLPSIISSALDLFLGLVTGLLKAIPQLIDKVLGMLPQLVNTLLGMLPTIISTALQLFMGILLGLVKAIPQILVALIGMLPQILSTLLQMIPTLIQTALQLFLGIVTGLIKAIPEIVNQVVAMWPDIQRAFQSFGPQLVKAGGDIIAGLVNGIARNAGRVVNSLMSMAKDAIGSVMSFFGINSPSKLFADYGKYIDQGFAKGILDNAGLVTDAMESLGNTAIEPIVNASARVDELGAVPSAPRAPGAGAGGTTVNRNDNRKVDIVIPDTDPYVAAVRVLNNLSEEATV